MTREKAIEYINKRLDAACDDADAMDDEMYEALQVLVKIAEQEPCEDVLCHTNLKENAELVAKILNYDARNETYPQAIKGKWEKANGDWLTCSECGFGYNSEDFGSLPQCPVCLADMRSEESEG